MEKDEKKTFEMYLRAGEQGHVAALCEVGNCYRLGLGVAIHETLCFEYYNKAAKREYPEGIARLAML